jgi:hypothetical protein
MSQPQLSESLLLVYCNKVDIPGAASASELARLLEVRDAEASHLVLSTTPPGTLFEHCSWSPTWHVTHPASCPGLFLISPGGQDRRAEPGVVRAGVVRQDGGGPVRRAGLALEGVPQPPGHALGGHCCSCSPLSLGWGERGGASMHACRLGVS